MIPIGVGRPCYKLRLGLASWLGRLGTQKKLSDVYAIIDFERVRRRGRRVLA